MRSKAVGKVFILFFSLLALFSHLPASVAGQGDAEKTLLVSKAAPKRILILYSYGYQSPVHVRIHC